MIAVAAVAMLALQISPEPSTYVPLAAALVIDGQLVLADVPTKTLRPIPVGNLIPEEADLSVDKKQIVFNAFDKADGRSRLFLLDVESGLFHKLAAPYAGDQRFPRFSQDRKSVVFVGAPKSAPEGPGNRTRLARLTLADGAVKEIATNPEHCEFSPAPFGGDRIAHVSTSCYIHFALQITDLASGRSTDVAPLKGSTSETAVSTDGKKLVYTRKDMGGLEFYVIEGNKPPRWLKAVRITSQRVQPRFVCPQNLMFVNEGKVWSLDSKSGALDELMEAKLDLQPVKPPSLPEAPTTAPGKGTP